MQASGISRTEEGLKKGRQLVRALRERFWKDVFVPGSADDYNNEIEKAGRVADFLELAELLLVDAERRKESAGGHFREEYQSKDGEAVRNDTDFAYVAAWEWKGWESDPELHREDLEFKDIELKTRSYE